MTAENHDIASPVLKREFVWNLILGFLVSALSVLTAGANYLAYQTQGVAADFEAEGDRALALSNTEYLRANQFIILDYTMFDGEFIQRGVDDVAADYYKLNFSQELQNSIDRNSPFDDQYYVDMYAASSQSFDDAFASYRQASVVTRQEEGFQLAMLIASVGLAFSAYASLLNNSGVLRGLFALLAFLLLVAGFVQFMAARMG